MIPRPLGRGRGQAPDHGRASIAAPVNAAARASAGPLRLLDAGGGSAARRRASEWAFAKKRLSRQLGLLLKPITKCRGIEFEHAVPTHQPDAFVGKENRELPTREGDQASASREVS